MLGETTRPAGLCRRYNLFSGQLYTWKKQYADGKWPCRLRKKKWICTTDSNHKFAVYPNLIKDLTVGRINQLWVADLTYISSLVCSIYLAVILDVYSRKAIRYAISPNLDMSWRRLHFIWLLQTRIILRAVFTILIVACSMLARNM